MAEITPDSSLAEVINSLDLAVVPEKLHCSTCHGFLLNAYKTSCCEQNVCEKCFTQIADHCPMCKHKPFSKELCRPAKAMRNTVKAYVRNVEKTLADDRSKLQMEQAATLEVEKPKVGEVAEAQAEVNREVENGTIELPSAKSEEPTHDTATSLMDVQPSIEVAAVGNDFGEALASPTNNEIAKRQLSVESDANDDEVEIQVEPSAEDNMLEMPQTYEMDEQEQAYGNAMQETSKNGDSGIHDNHNGMDSNGFNLQNMNMAGFNNMGMDLNMMQQMMSMNMNQMMSMGANPMMYNGFGGSNGNMNGMNMMGMNLSPNQMFNGYGQNSNIWQNNNALSMGGDFGSHFGSNMSQQGNFYSQQSANGDFNGYNSRPGRGRFRGGRGSYNRGRGSYNQYQQNYGQINPQDQQQYDSQNSQAQMNQSSSGQNDIVKSQANSREEDVHDQDDFAPGGQDEVQEALGDSGQDPDVKENQPEIEKPVVEVNESQITLPEVAPITESLTPATQEKSGLEKIIPEAYHEDFDSMAPPTAPTGPSGRYSDKEFAFRARGHGKYSARARGSFSTSTPSTGIPPSPIRSVSQTSAAVPSPPAKGIGVVGAPTGPRAMREPPAQKSAPRPATNSGGFQIMGRASMQPQTSQTKEDERPKSATPTNGHDAQDDNRVLSRSHPKYDKHAEPNSEAGLDSNYDNDRSDRDRDRDRKSKKSKRSEYQDDYEMRDVDRDEGSADRESSYRSSRHAKEKARKEEKYSSAKHRSSGRYYEDEAGSEYDRDDYGESAVDKHRSSRSRKSSSKYDVVQDKERDSHRDRKRDRDRDRDRDRERDRERDRGEDKPKDKEDRHRKRSRHDRDREDEYDDQDDDESRHRSRRHKRDHHTSSSRREKDKETDDGDLGLRISGRSSMNRPSALPTPASATSSSIGNTDKDPNTLEREARNRERMLKEQQRREKAALDRRGSTATGKSSSRTATSSGRRVSYKYEDEVERGLGAADEREKARWR